MSPRPNILWIIADQLRADHVGFGGNETVRTPSLDALAARGTVFDRAHVANPICMPNRCSMLTGRMPSAHGVIFNDRSLTPDSNTFVRQLAAAGWDTALIGKAHIQHGMSRNVTRGGKLAPTFDTPWQDGWDALEDAERYVEGPVAFDDFYGFKQAEFSIGHGDMVTGHHYRWAIEKGADPALLKQTLTPDSAARQRDPNWWQVYQPEIPEEYYSTTFVTERSLEWLAERGDSNAPWLLQCSFPDPHHPFTPPGAWWERHDPAAMSLPKTFADPLSDAPAHLHFIRSLKPGANFVQMFGATEEIHRPALAAEYGMIEMIDAGIGRILAALESNGMADNTVVVFTSDHGDMFGDHGLMLKATMHYQGCLRVPLVIARPGQQPARTDALASSLDLASTFLDLAGVDGYDDMQGVSLGPVLQDPDARVRDHLFVEEDFPLARHGGPLPRHSRTLVTEQHRYSRYSSGDTELYDLQADPDECANLAAAGSSAARGEMAERLLDAMSDAASLASRGHLELAEATG